MGDSEQGKLLVEAASSGILADVHSLLKSGVSVNWQKFNGGQCALHVSSKYDHREVVKLLLDTPKVNVDLQDDYGWTALIYAARQGYQKTLGLLLKAGADISIVDQYKRTARDHAKAKGHHNIITLLKRAKEQCQKPLPYNNTIEDISTLEFSLSERSKLLSCKVYTLVPIGESMAGKTSLIRSLVLSESHLARVDDRTVVAELLSWIPEEYQDIIFLIYDIGGHKSYRNTSQCFQVNSPATMRLLCHDVTSTNFEGSIFWLKATQTTAPESKILLCFTQMDKLETDPNKTAKITACQDAFQDLIEQEIKVTEDSQKLAEKGSTNWNLYSKHLETYRSIKDQMRSNPIFLSCKPGNEHRISSLKKYLLKHFEGKETALLRNLDKELFLRIGTLGLKEPMVEESDYEEFSEGTLSATPNSRDLFIQDSAKSDAVQMHWEQDQFDTSSKKPDNKKPDSLKQQYITLDEAVDEFKEILKARRIPERNPVKETKKSLENLSKNGLLSYFRGDEDLEQIIFNDISTLVNILRCVYHHSVEQHLDFNYLDVELRHTLYENRRKRYEQDMSQLHQHGIMSTKLLRILLHKSHCLIDPSIVMKLLETLGIAYTFEAQLTNELQTFIPYFIEHIFASNEVDGYRMDVLTCDETKLGLHTVLKGTLPLSFFHTFLVKVCRRYVGSHFTQKTNQTWNRGLWVTLGKRKAKFMIYYNNQKEIECAIQADISDIQGHHIIWECIKFFDHEARDTRKSRFPGLILDYILFCTHCRLITGSTGWELVAKYEWDIETELLQNAVETYSCPYHTMSSDIPAALLAPLPPEDHMSVEYLEQLHKYLREMTNGAPHHLSRKNNLGLHDQREFRPLTKSTSHPSMYNLIQHTMPRRGSEALPQASKITEEMEIIVRPANLSDCRIQELLASDRVYPVLPRLRGRAIIINIDKFDDSTKDRVGSLHDAFNLVNLFKQLHFNTKLVDSPSKKEMLKQLDIESNNIKDCDAFVLCALSHGGQSQGQDFICGKDYNWQKDCFDRREIRIREDICAKFDGYNCPALLGKPKIFIIQACRGTVKTEGYKSVADSAKEHQMPNEPLRVHEKADFLIAHATVAEYVSWRRTDIGSWFVRTLVEVFAEQAHAHHVEEMLKEVRRRVETQTTDGGYVQMTENSSSLTKDFYFFPGYFTCP